jgi:glycosyltransferase involved in cell wall biosynthesis
VRILVATDQWFPDRMGGVARVATDTARGWAAAGHDVVVVAPHHDGEASEETLEDGALTLLRVLPRTRLPQTLTDPPATRRWASRLTQRQFDVLVAHGSTTACGLLAANLDLPLVYVFHADAAKEARFLRATLRPGARWVSTAVIEGRLRSLDRIAFREAASVVVLSEFSRGLLSERAPTVARRAVRVWGGVDTTVFSPTGRSEARRQLGVDPSTRLVFTARRLEPRMGLENLLGAAALLNDVEGVRVAIAGTGSLGRRLQDVRDELGVGDRVDLLGRVSDADLPLWHKAADLFVLPTLAYEGFGLVTAEALSSGTPVVATRAGATPELVAPLDPRLLARGTDPVALADAIREGLRIATPEFRARCRDYALARFAWNANLPAWEGVLDDAVLRHRRDPGGHVRRQHPTGAQPVRTEVHRGH